MKLVSLYSTIKMMHGPINISIVNMFPAPLEVLGVMKSVAVYLRM